MLKEVTGFLQPESGRIYADGTVGGGGHAAAILQASSPDGFLYGCDLDEWALEAASERLKCFSGRFEIRRGNFSGMGDWVPAGSCSGVLLDLGISSPQIDASDRGFSFQQEGPLDMRMDRREKLTAAELVNQAAPNELARIFWELGGEPHARRIARAIERQRQAQPFRTTRQLGALVESVVARRGRIHPATRIFQALRIAVNDELGNLKRGLEPLWKLLRPGGRLLVITFHSLEDRIVKEFGRRLERNYTFRGEIDLPELREPVQPQLRWISRKTIRPSADELAENPRARSAQLRVMEKL